MNEALEFTGERMIPEKSAPDTFWEHIHRYRFAARFVKGKRVLDIACGEGYGAAALLRAGATSLIGVDVSPEACEYAARRYGIQTRIGDALKIPLEDASVDVVVSFETIEHVARPDLFLDECVRVLAPGGQVVISTPNREAYNELAPNNPYHLKELSEAEFVTLLGERFGKIELFSQRPQSVAWWSVRVLASERSFWKKLRGFGWVQRVFRFGCCREVSNQQALKLAREHPVQTIVNGQRWFSHLANPYAIRRRDDFSRELPIYLVAVVSDGHRKLS